MRLAILIPLVLSLAGCALRYDVKTDYDPAVDYAAFRTYALPPRERSDTPNEFDNSLVLKRIEGMVVRHLEARGLARAEPGAADLTVRFWLTAEKKTDISTVPASPFYGPWGAPYPHPYDYGRWGPMYNDVIVRNYVEGTLVLDLVDAKRNELVWRAYVVGTVSRDREAAFAALDEALVRALMDYPPGRAPAPK
jgi:hypothetical protein